MQSIYHITVKGGAILLSFDARCMYQVESCICGFRIYKEIWTPYIEERLGCAQEQSNRNPSAVALKKDTEVIGHVPHTMSCICLLFLW